MDDDRRDIENIIARQFRSLNWGSEQAADWDAFISDFLPGALLYPAARPVKSQTPVEFVKRMEGWQAPDYSRSGKMFWAIAFRFLVTSPLPLRDAGLRKTRRQKVEA